MNETIKIIIFTTGIHPERTTIDTRIPIENYSADILYKLKNITDEFSRLWKQETYSRLDPETRKLVKKVIAPACKN